ncbi:hypothetical protein A2935_01065 [Candidatus Wolfebacteria bacterium RIFCSPLOWO2_01_FULL_47_17b]|uniref:Four helix bundle protein n=1 Tax=Candidatus Wolfebacteria bacterium RIFCSPLOWO2_01_FULL_47_17b TaxID=1802558 RepID=A0A1F8DZC6_9BACT|nr:MAG: hypothetical protein A2935_01065 [Candidatus Wolfebacteria bacterium RIFCSPLOWO2_01_FULL_47_17b]
MQKLKTVYGQWYIYYHILPKPHRHSLGWRIDSLFIETIEAVATAGFLMREEKLPYVRYAIRKLDTIQVLLLVLWENKSLTSKQYILIAQGVEEVGRNLGGWSGKLRKENSPTKQERK